MWQGLDNLKRLGRYVGEVLDIDIAGDPKLYWRKFTRIRIEIDINALVKSGVFLPCPSLNDTWVGFKFEKLQSYAIGAAL